MPEKFSRLIELFQRLFRSRAFVAGEENVLRCFEETSAAYFAFAELAYIRGALKYALRHAEKLFARIFSPQAWIVCFVIIYSAFL